MVTHNPEIAARCSRIFFRETGSFMNEGLSNHRINSATSILLRVVLVWATFFFLLAHPGPICASLLGEEGTEMGKGIKGDAFDFDTAVRICLKRSPFLVRSSLEIDVRRMDETDSRYSFFPTISVRTRYYINSPKQSGVKTEPYALEFSTDGYNPLEAYFSLKARKLLTQIAILSHHQVISKGLLFLAQQFLELTKLHLLTAAQEELVTLAQKRKEYLRERQKLGESTTLEVKIASQELGLAQREKERLLSSQTRLKEGIRSFVGLNPDQKIHFDLQTVTKQVIGPFDASAASLADARGRSFEIKIQALAKELQALRVMLAKAKILPNLFMGVQSPDPLNNVSNHGLFFSVGLSWPVWDGFQRIRDISRQKTILNQYSADQEVKNIDLSKEWQEAKEKLSTAEATIELAKSQEELSNLKVHQSEIRYYHEGEPLTSVLAERRGYMEAKKNTHLKSLELEQAQLFLRYLSGDLVCHYVDERSSRP